MPHPDKHDLVTALWRYLARPLAAVAAGILIATLIVRSELWAIQRAPLSLSSSRSLPPTAGCLLADSADVLPVAILH